MDIIKRNSELHPFTFKELPQLEQQLVEAAKKARQGSHSPYSNFQVGAALRLASGKLVLGSNQENAAYPSGLCAERTALFWAGANHPGEIIEALAVCVKEGAPHLPFPCGSCLQVISEYQKKQEKVIDIYLIHPQEDLIYKASGVEQFLPFSFNRTHLP